MSTLLVSAGDASGDLHAGAFVEALRKRLPDVRVVGLGGAELEKAGVALTAHQRELAIGGFIEVLGSLRRIVRTWRRLRAALKDEQVDLVVLVDSPDFNIPFARGLKRRGIPVLYYISPQVWAWRSGRVAKIARRVDRMAVIFPFETEVYAGTDLPVEFVGHPLVDRLPPRRPEDRAAARVRLGLDAERPLVLLLPGSRRNEWQHCLGCYLETARRLHARDPELHFAVALAPSLEREPFEAAVRAADLPADLRLDLVQGETHAAMRAADVAIAKPGTVTVELALSGTPMVVAGSSNPLSVYIARKLVHLTSYAMPNLIAGREILPEFIQEDAIPEEIADAVIALLSGPARTAQLDALRDVRRRLGHGGAAERAAEIAEEMLGGTVRA